MSRRPSERLGDPLPPPSSETLRRAALARSRQRGERVARRRLAWRWVLWGLGRALKWLLPAGAALAGLAALLWLAGMWWPRQATHPDPAGSRSPGPTTPASAAAPALALPPPATPALPLRLDDGETGSAAAAEAPASRAQSVSNPPNVADRSSP